MVMDAGTARRFHNYLGDVSLLDYLSMCIQRIFCSLSCRFCCFYGIRALAIHIGWRPYSLFSERFQAFKYFTYFDQNNNVNNWMQGLEWVAHEQKKLFIFTICICLVSTKSVRLIELYELLYTCTPYFLKKKKIDERRR